MAKLLRVGLIGANPSGGWTRESHIPAIKGLAGLELAAVAPKTQSAASSAAQAFSVPKAYGNVADLFRDASIDLVSVVATLPAHRELVLSALAAGKHIYCEYPLGINVEESRQLAEAAQAAGVHAAIGLQARASPTIKLARHLLAKGAIGRPLTASILSTTVGFGPVIDRSVAYTEDPANGVTVITIQAAHTIDLAIALLGGVADLAALVSTQYPSIRIGTGQPLKRRTNDHLLVQARHDSGTPLSVEVAGGRAAGTPFRFEIVGDAGVLTLEGGAPRGFQSGRLRLSVRGEPQLVDEGELAPLQDAAVNVAATYAQLRDDIAEGTWVVTGFSHGARLAQLIRDASSSSETGSRKTRGDWPLG
jgi:predicted dehydrogenase